MSLVRLTSAHNEPQHQTTLSAVTFPSLKTGGFFYSTIKVKSLPSNSDLIRFSADLDDSTAS